jgi:pimeloyl-ACP methyl ester carboxylesterase
MPEMLIRPDRPALAYEALRGRGPTIVFLPGYRSDMTGGKATALAEWAAAEGRAMLRLDYAGCGASAGVFGAETLANWRDDVLDAIDQLTGGPLVLVGSSMGGWLMVLAALARTPRIAGLIGIAAAPDFTDWGFDDHRRAILQEDGILVEPSDYGEPQITTLEFWRSGQSNLLLGEPIAFDGPVRLLHGLQDDVVPTSIALRLGRALRSADVQTILVKDGDHRLSRPQDVDLLIATVSRLVESL